jgi:hypothetical protein
MATDQSAENIIAELERHYMLLDSSLIHAIISDYDIHTGSGGHKLSSTKGSQSTSEKHHLFSDEESGTEATPNSDLVTLANALSSIGVGPRDSSSTDLSSLRYFEIAPMH